jgi:NDP-sugar pyrophosphorylase family protein
VNSLPRQAIILAAGFGTRLLPITRYLPKPLLPILDVPAIEAVFHRISQAGFERIVINTHHLSEQIEAWAKDAGLSPAPILSHEVQIMDTAGALALARQFLEKDAPLLIWNSDVVANVDPALLWQAYERAGCPAAMLVVHDRPPFNKLGLDQEGNIASFSFNGPGARAFTGISIIGPELLSSIALTACPLVEVWLSAIENRQRVAAIEISRVVAEEEPLWEDIGTFEGYFRATRAVMDAGDIGSFFISSRARMDEPVYLSGTVAIYGDARLSPGTRLHDAVVLPGTDIAALEDRDISRAIVTAWGICHF